MDVKERLLVEPYDDGPLEAALLEIFLRTGEMGIVTIQACLQLVRTTAGSS
jgi:hypothetical protein